MARRCSPGNTRGPRGIAQIADSRIPLMNDHSAARAPRLYALVPCAGSGARAGAQGPKQYVPVDGRVLVGHTLRALQQVPRLHAVMVVLAPDDSFFETEVPDFTGPQAWVVRAGGATRAATVANGLIALRQRGATDDDWVLVHDAARALIRPQWVERLIDACIDDAVGGLLALPVADTLKSEQDGRAASTVDRRGKWAAQTPQMFRLKALHDALAQAGDAVTDDASAIEATGARPLLVMGDAANIKITWPEDFARAHALLRASEGETSMQTSALRM